jgi:hypothetical protein
VWSWVVEKISSSSTSGVVENLAAPWIHFIFAVPRGSREVGGVMLEHRVIISSRSTVCESARTPCPRGENHIFNANASQ